jgi:serine/threonine protein kinase/tetratricopeptide (TPR) repeat protein
LVAEFVSRYRIISKLGAGGMGEVYLAEDTTLRRKVALKLLSGEYTRNKDALRRFVHEAQAASALNHPNILTIHEFGQQDGVQYLATEFVEGQTLRQRLAAAPMGLADTLDIGIQVGAALAAAHQAGIVHRDVKPENIMLRPDGYVKVLDFGVAKLTEQAPDHLPDEARSTLLTTEPGVIMGTPNYMSPEQVRGYPVDTRSDIFSLGVVIYEMVAGCQPFEGPTFSDVIAAILTREPPSLDRYRPDAPPELQRIVSKALAKNRDDRYQSAQALVADLKSLRREVDINSTATGASTAAGATATAGAATSAGANRVSGSDRAVDETIPTRRITTADHTNPLTSAEYLINGIKRHKTGAGAVLLALLVAVAGVVLRSRSSKPGALTERDTVLVADFANSTGEQVFDQTLKQALATQLEQSPFLNIYPEARIRETLKFMGLPDDERVTEDIARQICQRQGIKALLAGSISSLGSHYVISLQAINAASGDVIARSQVEAASREKVLTALGTAASGLREKLGESLSSIQKFDAPIEQATTPSLEALRSFAAGDARRDSGDVMGSIPFYKHATELDPNFALAYARLAAMYGNSHKMGLAVEASQKAFDLRDRVTEHERLYISSHYYNLVTGELDKHLEILKLWEQTYPRDFTPFNNLATKYIAIGQPEKAVEQASEAIRINPAAFLPHENLSQALQMLGRFDEQKQVVEQALARNPDDPECHGARYAIAFLEQDKSRMQQEVAWAAGKQIEPWFLKAQAAAAAFEGRLNASAQHYRDAADALRVTDPAIAASTAMDQLVTEELFGKFDRVEDRVSDILSMAAGSRDALSLGALALCLAGHQDRARPLMDELAKRYPKDTSVNSVLLPTVKAAIELAQSNPARAIELLQVTRQFEFGEMSGYWPNYLRAMAYIRAGQAHEGAAEFQKILDHRGTDLTSCLHPLSQLGLARAAAMTGDTARSRKAYQDLFSLWKDADPDLPLLKDAKQQYEKLK